MRYWEQVRDEMVAIIEAKGLLLDDDGVKAGRWRPVTTWEALRAEAVASLYVKGLAPEGSVWIR